MLRGSDYQSPLSYTSGPQIYWGNWKNYVYFFCDFFFWTRKFQIYICKSKLEVSICNHFCFSWKFSEFISYEDYSINLWLKEKVLYAVKSWWNNSNALYLTDCKAWQRLCYGLQNQGIVSGEGQIESNQLLQHMAASPDPIWNGVCGSSRICTHAR